MLGVFVLTICYGWSTAGGFVLNANAGTLNDSQYLHLLLADEKAERIRLQADVTEMQYWMHDMQVKIDRLESTGTTIQQPNVAFRVELSKDLGSVSTNHVVIFDEVDLNLGNAYDVRHGIFTAPHNGTYVFSMALGNPAHKPGAFFMKKNGQTVEYAIAGHTTGWNMGGVTTVVELFENDDVWVEGEGYISGAYSHIRYHTGFSGILVHPYY